VPGARLSRLNRSLHRSPAASAIDTAIVGSTIWIIVRRSERSTISDPHVAIDHYSRDRVEPTHLVCVFLTFRALCA
jgi:hypothetical protein